MTTKILLNFILLFFIVKISSAQQTTLTKANDKTRLQAKSLLITIHLSPKNQNHLFINK